MDLTVDNLEQMFQSVEMTLECLFRRTRWEMQQQDEDGSFPVDPLLLLEELEFFQKRLTVLVAEAQELRAQKKTTMAAIREKVEHSTRLACDVQSRTAAPTSITSLLPSLEESIQEAWVPDSSSSTTKAENGTSSGQPKDLCNAQSNSTAPRAQARGASSPSRCNAKGPLRVRRPPL